MANIWFSSDQHHRHKNIIQYCNRPYSSVEEMTEGLIENHNKLVKPNDTFYHIGDFAFSGAKQIHEILGRMNGKKIFIEGNHDNPKHFVGVVEDFRTEFFGKVGPLTVHMYHFPMISWNASSHGSVHLHGHVHSAPGSDNPTKLRFDVGVDAQRMLPLSLDDLLVQVEIRNKNRDLTNHHDEKISEY